MPWWSSLAVLLFALAAACEAPSEHDPIEDDYLPEERTRLIQCCQGLVHEAWNSDPPNAMVLHSARACEALAREGRLEEARSKLRASGHASTCDLCPLHGCRPAAP